MIQHLLVPQDVLRVASCFRETACFLASPSPEPCSFYAVRAFPFPSSGSRIAMSPALTLSFPPGALRTGVSPLSAASNQQVACASGGSWGLVSWAAQGATNCTHNSLPGDLLMEAARSGNGTAALASGWSPPVHAHTTQPFQHRSGGMSMLGR